MFQLFKARPHIQRESSSRATPDFPREDDNRHNQVLFHLHPRAVCLRLRWVTSPLVTYSSGIPLFGLVRFVTHIYLASRFDFKTRLVCAAFFFSFFFFLVKCRMMCCLLNSHSILGMNQLMWYYADLEKMKCYHTSDDLPDFDNQEKACSIWRRFAKYDGWALSINTRKAKIFNDQLLGLISSHCSLEL